jgi:hypothetical protein
VSLEYVLGVLAERGLSVRVDETMTPRLCGPRAREEMTDALKEALEAYREEIIARFAPRLTRRVVLLVGDRDSAVDRVLEECLPHGHHDRVRHWAERHPGRTVAGEWLHAGHWGERWERFLTTAQSSCNGSSGGSSRFDRPAIGPTSGIASALPTTTGNGVCPSGLGERPS